MAHTISKSDAVFGNRATGKVHTEARFDACTKGMVKAKNRVKFASLKEALEAGFEKCKRCFKKLK